MGNKPFRKRIHELDVTVRVGKGGIESVSEEVNRQLEDRKLIKIKFLRSSRGGTDTETLAAELADAVGGEVVDVRGHTAVLNK